MKKYLFIVTVFMLGGCSNQLIYEEIQRKNQFDCYSLPVSQQDDCIESSHSMSYEEYERERQKALNQDSAADRSQ